MYRGTTVTAGRKCSMIDGILTGEGLYGSTAHRLIIMCLIIICHPNNRFVNHSIIITPVQFRHIYRNLGTILLLLKDSTRPKEEFIHDTGGIHYNTPIRNFFFFFLIRRYCRTLNRVHISAGTVMWTETGTIDLGKRNIIDFGHHP